MSKNIQEDPVYVEPDRLRILGLAAAVERVDAILERGTATADDEGDIGRMLDVCMQRKYLRPGTAVLSNLINQVTMLPDIETMDLTGPCTPLSDIEQMSLYAARNEAGFYLHLIGQIRFMDTLEHGRYLRSIKSLRIASMVCWTIAGLCALLFLYVMASLAGLLR